LSNIDLELLLIDAISLLLILVSNDAWNFSISTGKETKGRHINKKKDRWTHKGKKRSRTNITGSGSKAGSIVNISNAN